MHTVIITIFITACIACNVVSDSGIEYNNMIMLYDIIIIV